MHLLNLHPSPRPAPGQCWADTLQTENGVLGDHLMSLHHPRWSGPLRAAGTQRAGPAPHSLLPGSIWCHFCFMPAPPSPDGGHGIPVPEPHAPLGPVATPRFLGSLLVFAFLG